jgi:anti-anti-sigma factor
MSVAVDRLIVASENVAIIIDWAAVDFLHPLAIGILLERKAAIERGGGSFVFARMSKFVRAIFWQYGMDEIFEIYSSIEEALESMSEEWSDDAKV